ALPICRRHREAAMADNLGGDALAHLALGLRIDRQGEIRMRLDVDKARREGEGLGVDDLSRGAGDVGADRRDAPVGDSKIAGDSWTAGTVVQNSAADQDVVHRDANGEWGIANSE